MGNLFLSRSVREHTMQEVSVALGIVDKHGSDLRHKATSHENCLELSKVLYIWVGCSITAELPL